MTVVAVNQPPTAVDDTASVAEDGSASIDVVANDIDPDGGALSVSALGQPSHGSTALAADGTVTYIPAANYNGPDAFGYTVADTIGFTDSAMVTVTVSATNDAPTANADAATTNEDTPVAIDVVANDTDIELDTLTPSTVVGARTSAQSRSLPTARSSTRLRRTTPARIRSPTRSRTATAGRQVPLSRSRSRPSTTLRAPRPRPPRLRTRRP